MHDREHAKSSGATGEPRGSLCHTPGRELSSCCRTKAVCSCLEWGQTDRVLWFLRRVSDQPPGRLLADEPVRVVANFVRLRAGALCDHVRALGEALRCPTHIYPFWRHRQMLLAVFGLR